MSETFGVWSARYWDERRQYVKTIASQPIMRQWRLIRLFERRWMRENPCPS